MEYVLLWLGNLAVALLLVAAVAAIAGRWRPAFPRVALPLVVALGVLVVYLGLTAAAGDWSWTKNLFGHCFYPFVGLTTSYAIGAGLILIAGMRRGPSGPRSAAWPRGKLVIGVVVAIVLHATTVYVIDSTLWRQAEALRAEANQLSLSVAPERLPDRDNAAPVYARAIETLGSSGSWPEADSARWQAWKDLGVTKIDPNDPQLRAFLKQHSRTLTLLRAAADKPGYYFHRDYSHPDIAAVLPSVAGINDGVHLLAFNARVQAADHRMHDALNDCRVLLVMAEHVGGEPLLVLLVISRNIESIAAAALEAALASAPASLDDLAAVDRTLNRDFSHQQSFQRAVCMEDALLLAMISDFATAKCSIFGLASGQADWPAPSPRASAVAFIYRFFLLDEEIAAYRPLIREYHRLAGQPYFRSKLDWSKLDKERERNCKLISALMLPALTTCAHMASDGDAHRGLMRLGVAAYRFRAQRGRLPEKAEELAPEFLAAAPQDPFDGKPLRMKKTDRGLVLYSVGPDGIDDGGKEYNQDEKTGDITFKVIDHAARGPGK